MCLVAIGLSEELIVELLNCKVLMRLTELAVSVVVVKNCRSYCHYFLGTYDEWFYQNLAGIQNPVNGYETVTIRPEIYEELDYVNASVDTVRGMLVSNWKVEADGRVTMQITVPVGTTAEILLPTSDSNAVQLNGAALAEQTGILEIGEKDGRVMVKAISGSYNFELAAIG